MAAAAASAALLLGAGGVALTFEDDGEPEQVPTASQVLDWREGVRQDYQALAGSSLAALQVIADWDQARNSTADVAASVQAGLAGSLQTRRALAERSPLPGTGSALLQFRMCADLYVHSFRTVLAATALPSGDLQAQVRRSAARLRDLGDRVFEQGNNGVKLLLPPESVVDDVELRRPPDVTDYDSIGLGPGPPLEPRTASPRAVRTYQSERPQQSVADWNRAVRGLDAPTSSEISSLLQSGSADALADSARALVAASDALYDMPDPKGRRPDSTQLQLGFLVAAEALRAAQAALLVGDGQEAELRSIASDLHDVSVILRRSVPV